MRTRFSMMLAALWWGSLTGLFVVVPMLFLHLGSPAVAGAMAARLFSAQTWLSTACIMFMLLALNKRGDPAQISWGSGAMKPVVAGLLLALLVEFGVAPHIISARAGGGNLKFWHGLGSAMLLGQWLCAGITLWRLTRHTDSTG
ncbi:MAG: DUF4149 domain-containing protein [Polaromonas sp.]|nr:DUF4149 domain-containing protein [Polaromonas sp.]